MFVSTFLCLGYSSNSDDSGECSLKSVLRDSEKYI